MLSWNSAIAKPLSFFPPLETLACLQPIYLYARFPLLFFFAQTKMFLDPYIRYSHRWFRAHIWMHCSSFLVCYIHLLHCAQGFKATSRTVLWSGCSSGCSIPNKMDNLFICEVIMCLFGFAIFGTFLQHIAKFQLNINFNIVHVFCKLLKRYQVLSIENLIKIDSNFCCCKRIYKNSGFHYGKLSMVQFFNSMLKSF